mmetsp:Transcript_7774/g.11484  ORF Transcript_7774/g.11484 Transcript_7774/m.11484 type:complete len:352 (+) Transcript_7774:1787-2842(+)
MEKDANSTKSEKATNFSASMGLMNAVVSSKDAAKNETIVKPCRKRKKEQKKMLSHMDKLLGCARIAEKKGNACLLMSKTEESKGKGSSSIDSSVPKSGFRIITSSANDFEGINLNGNIILVKPLIVLDLNGILCRRVRRKNCSEPITKELEKQFRPYIGHVAGTPVIPRMNLDDFLSKLDARFTLAVWSSAQRKTAVKLVDLLFPADIAKRLLFVWGQNMCVPLKQPESEDRTKNDPGEIFSKPLCKVWDMFPLWNQWNTLLVDDSPSKCVTFKANTINPPSMKGISAHFEAGHYEAENQREQGEFFDKLADHFKPGYDCYDIQCSNGSSTKQCKLLPFLREIIPERWNSK